MPDPRVARDMTPSAQSDSGAASTPGPHTEAGGSGACRRCIWCEGQEHHWMYVGDEDVNGEPVMSCKHCDATRPVEDDDE